MQFISQLFKVVIKNALKISQKNFGAKYEGALWKGCNT
jgi:hypothetical protein